MAKKWHEESIEEMVHADDLVVRTIFLEGHPNLQDLAPLIIGENIREVLDADLRLEYEARTLYREAHDVCRNEGDLESMKLFERLLKDEEGHIDFIETQIDLYEQIGKENYGALNATPTDQAS